MGGGGGGGGCCRRRHREEVRLLLFGVRLGNGFESEWGEVGGWPVARGRVGMRGAEATAVGRREETLPLPLLLSLLVLYLVLMLGPERRRSTRRHASSVAAAAHTPCLLSRSLSVVVIGVEVLLLVSEI